MRYIAVESNPPIQQNGNSIRIGYDLPEDVRRHVSISYEITVPADTSVQAHSGSGSLGVEGVRAEVQAQTGSGDIRVRDVGGRSHVQTGSGSIRAENVAAPFYAHTGSGDIEAELTGSGDVDVQTGSGGAHVRGIKGSLRAHSGSGDLSADGSVGGPWNLHTGSGSIRLAVGTGSGFNLDVHTSSGSIHSDLPITVQGSMGHHELKGTVRGGGPDGGSFHRLRRCGHTVGRRDYADSHLSGVAFICSKNWRFRKWPKSAVNRCTYEFFQFPNPSK